VTVGVAGRADRAVAHEVPQLLHVATLSDVQRGVGMSEVVEPESLGNGRSGVILRPDSGLGDSWRFPGGERAMRMPTLGRRPLYHVSKRPSPDDLYWSLTR
jgi:hypothetical protein